MLTYLSEINHKAAFIQVNEHLRLTDRPAQISKESATEIESLRDKVDQLERLVGAVTMLDPNLAERARALLKTQIMKYGSRIVLEKPIEELSAIECLTILADLTSEKKKALSNEEREEYERMLRENNNNGS